MEKLKEYGAIGSIILIVGIVFTYLLIWFLLKTVGLITGFIDRHVFKKI
jgi:hypothetical protein